MTLDATFLGLVAFSLVAAATPGPNNMMVLASAANFGFRRSIPHMLGIAVGFMALTVMVGFGLGQVFQRFPAVFVALQIACILYLLWLAWKIANAASLGEGTTGGRPQTFLQGALFQWVNPKAWFAATTGVAAYLVAPDPATNSLIAATVFGIVCLPSLSVWAVFGLALSRALRDPARLRAFNWLMAALLVASLWPAIAEMIWPHG